MADKLTTTYTAVGFSSADEQQRLVQLLDEYLLSLDGGEPITSEELLGRNPDVVDRHTRSVATDVGVLFLAVVGVFASLMLIADERAAKVEAYGRAAKHYGQTQSQSQKQDLYNTRSHP